MNKAQIRKYWREWSQVRKALISKYHFEPQEAADFRHELHVRSLGTDKSHKDFSNDDFSKVLASFWAYSKPADLNAQLRQQDQQKTRTQYALKKLCQEHNLSDEYVNGMALKICKKKLRNCEHDDLVKLIAAINFHLKRKARKCPSNTPHESVI